MPDLTGAGRHVGYERVQRLMGEAGLRSAILFLAGGPRSCPSSPHWKKELVDARHWPTLEHLRNALFDAVGGETGVPLPLLLPRPELPRQILPGRPVRHRQIAASTSNR